MSSELCISGSRRCWQPLMLLLLLLQLLLSCRTHTAAGAVHQGLCQLLNQGVNLDTTPLMLACKYGHAEAVLTLLQHGADPQLSDRRGNNTCLHTAAYAGHASVIRVSWDVLNQSRSEQGLHVARANLHAKSHTAAVSEVPAAATLPEQQKTVCHRCGRCR
jgi:ankyrin repeat protein